MEQKIIQEYLEGKSISFLSQHYNIPYGRIQRLLKSNNVTIRGGRKLKVLSEEQKKQATDLFNEGIAIKTIAKTIGTDVTVLNRFIEEQGLTRSKNRVNKRILDDYFSKIDSSEKAYWLGFLFTDGTVDENKGSKRIRLQLQQKDISILEKLKECLQLDSKIIYDKRPNSVCCSVEFVSEQIFNDLGNYGIVPNKTYVTKNIPYDKIPKEFLPAFALGLLDGDGSVQVAANDPTDVTVGFTSYYESVVKDFQMIVDSLIEKEDHSKLFFTSAWHTHWRGRQQVLKILDKLYSSCPLHLERKYENYLKIKESLGKI